jgi:thiamine pyrophosphokinase
MENQQLFQDINKHPIIQILGPMDCDTRQLKNGLPTVFVDGGAKYRSNISPSASYTIGDADGHLDKADFDHVLPQNKDISDLGFILSSLEGQKTIFMEGFTGGRLDHQLFVYGEVHQFIKSSGSQVIIDQNMYWPGSNPGLNKEENLFSEQITFEGTFSVGCLEETLINISGDCDYPLENFSLSPLSSRGLSNVAKGEVIIKANKPFWIYLL